MNPDRKQPGNIVMIFQTEALPGASSTDSCVTSWPRLGHRATFIMRRTVKAAASISPLVAGTGKRQSPGKWVGSSQLLWLSPAALGGPPGSPVILTPHPFHRLRRIHACRGCLLPLWLPLFLWTMKRATLLQHPTPSISSGALVVPAALFPPESQVPSVSRLGCLPQR